MSVGTKPRRVRVSPGAIAILALVFLLAALGTGFVALNQKSTTGQWHSRYQSQVVVNRALRHATTALSKDLVSARGAITFLNSNTSALNRQIKSLQTQLSSASSARQKAFAKSPLFGQISSEAVTAANEASVCAGEIGSLQTEINDDLANPTHKDPLLQGEHAHREPGVHRRQTGQPAAPGDAPQRPLSDRAPTGDSATVGRRSDTDGSLLTRTAAPSAWFTTGQCRPRRIRDSKLRPAMPDNWGVGAPARSGRRS